MTKNIKSQQSIIYRFFFRLTDIITRNEVFCLLLFIYMIILIIGTLAQKDVGIYFAQQRYFASNIIWFNFIPFPGGKFILTLIFFSLLLKLFKDKWKKKKIGVLLLHFGVLILLLGAFISGICNQDGHMIIKEGEFSNSFIRKDLYEIILENKVTGKTFSIEINNKDKEYRLDDDVSLKINSFNLNSNLSYKYHFLKKNETFKFNRFFLLLNSPTFIEQENNKASVFFTIKNNHIKEKLFIVETEDVNYSSYEDAKFKLFFLKKRNVLPFNVYLIKFNKIVYPGTNIAKSYKSELLINLENINIKQTIEMNKPYRFMGYTFYQTSFIENNFGNSTILTVVNNFGRIFPYISIIIIIIGFLFHLLSSSKRLFRD